MIRYNPKDWFGLIFKFHKSDTFRILIPAMLCLAIYSGGIAYVEIEILKLKYKGTTTFHSLLGFVLSLLLVFRTNTAYERWWEGRKLWGSLLNNSRNMALKLKAFLNEHPNERHFFAAMTGNYAMALKSHLRDQRDPDQLEAEEADLEIYRQAAHVPNAIAGTLFNRINELYKNGKITGDQLIVLNQEITSFTDICGACERIRKTPIPYSYSLFLKKFIFAYIMTLPLGFVFDFGYWIIAVMIFMFYVLASLELIAEEIEDPFGVDANDLPVDEIAANIRMGCREILK